MDESGGQVIFPVPGSRAGFAYHVHGVARAESPIVADLHSVRCAQCGWAIKNSAALRSCTHSASNNFRGEVI